jgi:peptidylprolyl isomerase
MKPETGDTVRVHYTGTLSDGTQFDTSAGRDPIEFTLGEGNVIPGFEAAIADLEVGASATVTIPAADAYGDRHDEGVQHVPIEAFEGNVPQEGWGVELQTNEGERVNALVAKVAEDHVVLDFNHPLAGQDLTFELELVEIVGR